MSAVRLAWVAGFLAALSPVVGGEAWAGEALFDASDGRLRAPSVAAGDAHFSAELAWVAGRLRVARVDEGTPSVCPERETARVDLATGRVRFPLVDVAGAPFSAELRVDGDGLLSLAEASPTAVPPCPGLTLDESFVSVSAGWQMADWANGTPFLNGWCPERVAFEGGELVLSLAAEPCHGRAAASGEYRTLASHGYGRLEARIRAARAEGSVTALFFYTGPAEGTRHDEIDVEIFGGDPGRMQVNYWRDGVEHPAAVELGFDAAAGFHDYAIDWRPGEIRWYVDGRLVHREGGERGPLPDTPARIMVNLWACEGLGAWCGEYRGESARARYRWLRYAPLEEGVTGGS